MVDNKNKICKILNPEILDELVDAISAAVNDG